MRVLIGGCGYLGCALGRRLIAKGHAVTGVRRSADGRGQLEALGIRARSLDLASPTDLLQLPPDWDWVVHCAAPSSGDESAYRRVYLEGMRRLIEWLESHPPRAFVFTSSTSVYGQSDGSVVTEESPAQPGTPTANALVQAEGLLLKAAEGGFPGRILRVAGIYGPGRNRIAAAARGGWQIPSDLGRWVNMIHRDDLVEAIIMVLERGRDGVVYNVSDGTPVRQREFQSWLCGAMGLDASRCSSGRQGSATGRGSSNKRVSSDRIQAELGWRPRYPSFREGYAGWIDEWRKGGSSEGWGEGFAP